MILSLRMGKVAMNTKPRLNSKFSFWLPWSEVKMQLCLLRLISISFTSTSINYFLKVCGSSVFHCLQYYRYVTNIYIFRVQDATETFHLSPFGVTQIPYSAPSRSRTSAPLNWGTTSSTLSFHKTSNGEIVCRLSSLVIAKMACKDL